MGLDNRLFAVIMIGLFLVVLFIVYLFVGNLNFVQDACQEKGYKRYRIGSWFNGLVECRSPVSEELPAFKNINCNVFSRSCS